MLHFPSSNSDTHFVRMPPHFPFVADNSMQHKCTWQKSNAAGGGQKSNTAPCRVPHTTQQSMKKLNLDSHQVTMTIGRPERLRTDEGSAHTGRQRKRRSRNSPQDDPLSSHHPACRHSGGSPCSAAAGSHPPPEQAPFRLAALSQVVVFNRDWKIGISVRVGWRSIRQAPMGPWQKKNQIET